MTSDVLADWDVLTESVNEPIGKERALHESMGSMVHNKPKKFMVGTNSTTRYCNFPLLTSSYRIITP